MNVAGFRGDRIKVKPSLIVITYNSESQRKVLGRGSESQPTELAALSTDRYDLQKLQVEQIRREMEWLAKRLGETFLEGKRPLDVEDRPQLEEFIDAFTRFPEWLEYINLKYPPDKKGKEQK